ncbi:hypothetical protein DS62_01540 [Smithella sp. SC_K08D17]|jgi:predicted DNA-binding transcriptional regulator YafY|nr:hypothetical protein KD27_08470 [Smithella sp. D17]KIE17659.1 hypothetical protein DS62_01540 [Smithella sp. SC_K08D17]
MASKIILERFLWFHSEIKDLSNKVSVRNIEYSKTEVCLCFSKDVSSWIAGQAWHPAQKTRTEKNGRLCLTIPVADFREIKREILKYGSQVEVLSPRELQNEIRKEIEKMGKV